MSTSIGEQTWRIYRLIWAGFQREYSNAHFKWTHTCTHACVQITCIPLLIFQSGSQLLWNWVERSWQWWSFWSTVGIVHCRILKFCTMVNLWKICGIYFEILYIRWKIQWWTQKMQNLTTTGMLLACLAAIYWHLPMVLLAPQNHTSQYTALKDATFRQWHWFWSSYI